MFESDGKYFTRITVQILLLWHIRYWGEIGATSDFFKTSLRTMQFLETVSCVRYMWCGSLKCMITDYFYECMSRDIPLNWSIWWGFYFRRSGTEEKNSNLITLVSADIIIYLYELQTNDDIIHILQMMLKILIYNSSWYK